MSKVRQHIPPQRWSTRIPLEQDELHRLLQVLRFKAGAELEIVDGQGRVARASLQRDGLGSFELQLEDSERRELDLPEVTLVVALLKGRKLDDVVRQCTELGVTTILPVMCSRSVARPEGVRAEKRQERWRSIAAEAARQSGRVVLPQVERILDWDAFLGWLRAGGAEQAGVVFHEKAPKAPVSALWSPGADRRLVATGPEGGFSEEEVEALCAMGLRLGWLGPTVLRAETAAVVACALAVLTGD